MLGSKHDQSVAEYIGRFSGMSERKTNSIGSRLIGHFGGKSKNIGLVTGMVTVPIMEVYDKTPAGECVEWLKPAVSR